MPISGVPFSCLPFDRFNFSKECFPSGHRFQIPLSFYTHRPVQIGIPGLGPMRQVALYLPATHLFFSSERAIALNILANGKGSNMDVPVRCTVQSSHAAIR